MRMRMRMLLLTAQFLSEDFHKKMFGTKKNKPEQKTPKNQTTLQTHFSLALTTLPTPLSGIFHDIASIPAYENYISFMPTLDLY